MSFADRPFMLNDVKLKKKKQFSKVNCEIKWCRMQKMEKAQNMGGRQTVIDKMMKCKVNRME